MASTYVNDLRLEEIGSGEQSGSWGDTTNTNLELIAEAFSFGTEAITTNADTHTTTIADGATDPGRSLFLKYTGTLDSACTITIAPNTVSKLWFIENGTSGSQNILISQGSGANITIPAGQTKAVYSNGGGSGAVMVDAFATLNVVDLLVDDDLTVTDDLIVGGDIDLEGSIDVNGTANLDAVDIDGAVQIDNTVSVGVDDTGYDVKFFGDTASAYMLWDASADDLILGGAAGLSVNSAALVTGVLTTTAATVFNGGFASNAGSTVSNADNNATLELICTDNDAASGPRLDLYRNPGEAGADGDNLAQLNFYGLNDASEKSQYLYLFTEMADVADGSEDVRFLFGGLVNGADSSLIEFTHGTPATGADPELVFNNSARNIDFRVESADSTHAFFVSGAGEAIVGIGQSNPTSPNGATDFLHIGSSANQDTSIVLQDAVEIWEIYQNDSLKFRYDTTDVMVLQRVTGNVGIGSNSPDTLLHLSTATGPVLRFERNDTSITSGDLYGSIEFEGQDGSSSSAGVRAEIRVEGAGTGTQGETEILFKTSHTATTRNTEKMKIGNLGDVTVTSGNLVIGTSGKGIDFSAFSAPLSGMTNELLDRYEEGTYTPVLSGAGGGTDNGLGSYVIVGKLITVSVTFDQIGTGLSGNLSVSLPIAATPQGVLSMYVPIQWFDLDWTSGALAQYGYIGHGTSALVPYCSKDAASSVQIQGDALKASTYLRFIVTYEIA